MFIRIFGDQFCQVFELFFYFRLIAGEKPEKNDNAGSSDQGGNEEMSDSYHSGAPMIRLMGV